MYWFDMVLSGHYPDIIRTRTGQGVCAAASVSGNSINILADIIRTNWGEMVL